MSIYRGTGGASSVSGTSNIETVTEAASEAATSAAAAQVSETNAAASALTAVSAATDAQAAQTAAEGAQTAAEAAQTATESVKTATEAVKTATEAVYDNFDDRYLGDKASDPALDNDGDALVAGALYFNTTDGEMKVYTGAVWQGVTAGSTEYVTQDTTTGAADLPTGTTAQRPGTPAAGMFRFNSETTSFEGYSGTGWAGVGGASGGAGNPFVYENDQTVTADYTITSGKNAMSTGVLTIDSGVTVTVPSGSRWVII
jgi:hypothetical protein